MLLFIVVHSLLVVVAFLAAERGFQVQGLQQLRLCRSQSASAVAVVPGLVCFPAHGIFLDQGLGLCPRIGRQVLILCTTRQVPVGFHVETAMMRTTHHKGFHRNEGQQEHSSIILIILLAPTETDSVLCLAPNCRRLTLKDCHLGTSAL